MRLFRNIQLKILAIIFAMVLWFHVATNQRYDLEILYKISYVNIPDKLAIAEEPVGEVAVMLRGSGKGLMRLMWGERNWPLDLSRAKVGIQRVPMHAEQVPFYGIADLEVLGLLDGDTVTVILDSLSEKVVPIRSSVQIEPTEGFIVADAPILTPDSTVVIGPRQNLDQIHDVWTKPEFIVKVDGPVERLLPVLPPTVFGVTTGVQQIRLYHKIEPYLTRTFESVPVRVEGQLSSDEFEISPDRVFVEVAGPQSAVVQLVVDSIAVTCRPLTLEDTTIFVRAAVSVPAPLRVLKLSPDSVTVERSERTRADSGN